MDPNELLKDLDLTTDEGKAEFQRRFKAAFEDATAAQAKALNESVRKLEAKQREILAEKKAEAEKRAQLQETIDELGGEEGIQETREFRERMEKDELLKLLRESPEDFAATMEGRGEKKAAAKFEAQINKLTTDLKEATGQRDTYRGKFFDHQVQGAFTDAGLSKDVGIRPEAIGYMHWLVGNDGWTLDEESGAVVQRSKDGEIVIGEDGKPLAPKAYLLGQRDSDHGRILWPDSQPGGAKGGDRPAGGNGKFTVSRSAPMAEYEQVRQAANEAGQEITITD